MLKLILVIAFLTQMKCKDLSNEDCFNEEIQKICITEQDCNSCILKHECCSYCFQENYGNRKCQTKNNQKTCQKSNLITNSRSTSKKIDNEPFKNVDNGNAVQIKPQRVDVDLRVNNPINVTFAYKPAKDYPVYVYYLTDVTKTMQDSIADMAALGARLNATLTALTRRFRLAFGTYVDKLALPFYELAPRFRDDPCAFEVGRRCARAHAFRHALNFTEDVRAFARRVRETALSANLDNLEGGFDALMQVLLCEDEMGWNYHARKLVLLVTGSEMHFAGDGKLAGAVERNRARCYVDSTGTYASNTLYDYPSVEEVYNELRTKKVNVIIASNATSIAYYQALNAIMENHTYVGELNDTAKILDLVREGYGRFASEVQFSVKEGADEDLELKFFAKCSSEKGWEETNQCDKVQEGKVIEFKLQINQKSYQINKNYQNYVTIIEKNINETLHINLNYINSKCKGCNVKRDLACVNGIKLCDTCSCNDDWQGERCDSTCSQDRSSCRRQLENGERSTTCFGNGECNCGKCSCFSPYLGDPYCEHECPMGADRRICSGNGFCSNGTCVCNPSHKNVVCDCELGKEKCQFEGIECNKHGSCDCNRCRCDFGYSGEYCEYCSTCTGFCNIYRKCAEDFTNNKNQTTCVVNNRLMEVVQEDNEVLECKLVFKAGENNTDECVVNYQYVVSEGVTKTIKVSEKDCYSLVTGASIGWYIAVPGITLAIGLALILLFKLRNIYEDKREYAKFEKEMKTFKHSTNNPIYHNPTRQYKVPDELRARLNNFEL